jgi:arabinan endo-1,5-alpha-L-arabinosidase
MFSSELFLNCYQGQLLLNYICMREIRQLHIVLITIIATFVMSCGGGSSSSEGNGSGNNNEDQKVYYRNPVIKNNCPDPTVIDDRTRTGYFYAYSTQNGTSGNADCKYLPIYKSKDMVHWEFAADGFGVNRPQWVADSRIWAPDINYVNGQYVLYYALGVWDNSNLSSSGVAVSNSPTGPFVDKGEVVSLKTVGVANAIDPMLFIDDDGRKYLYFGSFGSNSGIWVIELADDGLSIKEGAEIVQLGADNMEGSYVIKRDGFYFMFNSKGSCCSGGSSTYHVVVSRSNSPLGPFSGPEGTLLTDPNYSNTILSSRNDKIFVGPGHDAQIITDDSGQDWMAYHAYWRGNGYDGRCMNLDKIVWKNGWPHFEFEEPTVSSLCPSWK